MKRIVDASVFCGCWPFRSLPRRAPEELKAHLRRNGISRAWVAAAEAILCPDPMQANGPFFSAVEGDDFFVPVAIINPTLGTWRRDAETCLRKRGARAVKLVPNYHRYELSDPRVSDLAAFAARGGVPVCIQVRMMDERAHHPLMKVPAVPPDDIAALAGRHPGTRFLACSPYGGQLEKLSEAPNVWAEISFVESDRALRAAVEAMGPGRVVFGSHSPLLYFQAEAAKLDVDPAEVAPGVVNAVRESNAAALLGRA